jgi:hypothetical protein
MKAENVFEESTVCVSVLAVDDHMRTVDHGRVLSSEIVECAFAF